MEQDSEAGAIAVFVSDSTADESIRERAIAQVTRTVWDEWSK
jgi:beta-lactamase class A